MDPESDRMTNQTFHFHLENVGEYCIAFRLPLKHEEVDQSDIDQFKFELQDFNQLASFKHNDIVISIQYIELQKLDISQTELKESLTRGELSVLLEYAYYHKRHEDLGNSNHEVDELITKGYQEAAKGSLTADSNKITDTIIILDGEEKHFTNYDPALMKSLEFMDLMLYVQPYVFVLRVSGFSANQDEIINIFNNVAESFTVDVEI